MPILLLFFSIFVSAIMPNNYLTLQIMFYRYHLKVEFRRRLIKLNQEIDRFLDDDEFLGFSQPSNRLMPYLFKVYSYLWCRSVKDLFSKKFISD